jgi:hypothetical protein
MKQQHACLIAGNYCVDGFRVMVTESGELVLIVAPIEPN